MPPKRTAVLWKKIYSSSNSPYVATVVRVAKINTIGVKIPKKRNIISTPVDRAVYFLHASTRPILHAKRKISTLIRVLSTRTSRTEAYLSSPKIEG